MLIGILKTELDCSIRLSVLELTDGFLHGTQTHSTQERRMVPAAFQWIFVN